VAVLADTEAPTVAFLAPQQGQAVLEGKPFTVSIAAADNVAVTQVEVSVGGAPLYTLSQAPYQLQYVALGTPSLAFRARAADVAGNWSAWAEVQVVVTADPALKLRLPAEVISADPLVLNVGVPPRLTPISGEAVGHTASLLNEALPTRTQGSAAETVGPTMSIANESVPERTTGAAREVMGPDVTVGNGALPPQGPGPREVVSASASVLNSEAAPAPGAGPKEAVSGTVAVKNDSVASLPKGKPPVGEPDSDGDGFADVEENARGTDLLNPDTDGDGMIDGDEVLAGTNPLDPKSPPAEVIAPSIGVKRQ
jgi:hypothetical protein